MTVIELMVCERKHSNLFLRCNRVTQTTSAGPQVWGHYVEEGMP